MTKKQLVVFVDEDENQRALMPKRIERAFDDLVTVVAIEPVGTVSDTFREILEKFQGASALMIDQSLDDTGKADFYGSDLALHCREFDPLIPIYILTSFADSEALKGRFSAYDYVIDKSDLNIPDNIPKELCAVLRRNIGNYNKVISERSVRMHDLLEKSTLADLSEIESNELNELLSWRQKPNHALENDAQLQLRKRLDDQEKELIEIEEKVNKILNK